MATAPTGLKPECLVLVIHGLRVKTGGMSIHDAINCKSYRMYKVWSPFVANIKMGMLIRV